MGKVADLSATVGEYQHEGNTKYRSVRIGVLMEHEGREYMLLDPSVSLAGTHALQRMYDHSKGRKQRDRLAVNVWHDDRSGSGGGGRSESGGGRSGQGGAAGQSGAGGADNDFDDDIPF